MDIGDRYYKASQPTMLAMIKEFGGADNLLNFFDNNNMWSYKQDDLDPELRKLLNCMTINKLYQYNQLYQMFNSDEWAIKASTLSKRLNKLKKLGYVGKQGHGQWVRLM